jgi:hypothetical protein
LCEAYRSRPRVRGVAWRFYFIFCSTSTKNPNDRLQYGLPSLLPVFFMLSTGTLRTLYAWRVGCIYSTGIRWPKIIQHVYYNQKASPVKHLLVYKTTVIGSLHTNFLGGGSTVFNALFVSYSVVHWVEQQQPQLAFPKDGVAAEKPAFYNPLEASTCVDEGPKGMSLLYRTEPSQCSSGQGCASGERGWRLLGQKR